MKKKTLFHSVLSVILVALLAFAPVTPLLQEDEVRQSYLAPRAFSQSPELLVEYITFTTSSLITAGVQTSKLLEQINGEAKDMGVASVQRAILDLEKQGIGLDLRPINEETLEMKFSGPLFVKAIRVDRFGVQELVEQKVKLSDLAIALKAFLISAKDFFIQPLLLIGEQFVLRTKLSARFFKIAIPLIILLFAVVGCDTKGGRLLIGKPSGSSGQPQNALPSASGDPDIIDQERNFSNPMLPLLQDVRVTGLSDSTIVLLTRVLNVDPNNAPTHFQVDAVNQNGKVVVLNPFAPIVNGVQDTYSKFVPIQAFGQQQVIIAQAFLVNEPTPAGVTFPASFNQSVFPPSQWRPVQAGDEVTLTLLVLDGTDPLLPRFSNSSPGVPRKDVSLPVVIGSGVSLIQNNGIPEPGNFVAGAVIQNPLGLANGRDGTMRLKYDTGIRLTDPIVPTQALVTVFNNSTGALINEHVVTLVNPYGVNEFDIPGTDSSGNPIAPGTQLKLRVQNLDLGLSPPFADANSETIFTFQQDANPLVLSQPQLQPDANGNSITILNGTRLLRFRINPNSSASEPLQPEFHFIRVTVEDPMTGNRFTHSLTVEINKDINGDPLLDQENSYDRELPASLFSGGAGLGGFVLHEVEVFNVRRGYKARSLGVVDLTQQPDRTFSSNATVQSMPTVNLVTANNRLIQVALSPNLVPNDPTIGHQFIVRLVHPITQDAIDVAFFRTLQPSGTYDLLITDPAAIDFLNQGPADVVSVTVFNVSDQVPSGPTTTFTPSGVQVQKMDTSSIGQPKIEAIKGSGDPFVSVDVRFPEDYAQQPRKLYFKFSLKSASGEKAVIEKSSRIKGAHLSDLTETQTYGFALDHPLIEKGTQLEHVSVMSVNEDGTFSPIEMIDVGGVLVDPEYVLKAPSITYISSGGVVSSSRIELALENEDQLGNRVDLNAVPLRAMVRLKTKSGLVSELPVSELDLNDASNKATLQIDFDSLAQKMGVSEEVSIAVRVAPEGRALSAYSESVAGYLVKADVKPAEERPLSQRRVVRKRVLYGFDDDKAQRNFEKIFGSVKKEVFVQFLTKAQFDQLKEEFKRLLQRDIQDAEMLGENVQSFQTVKRISSDLLLIPSSVSDDIYQALLILLISSLTLPHTRSIELRHQTTAPIASFLESSL